MRLFFWGGAPFIPVCKTIYRSVTKIPWAVSLKKTQFIFPSSKWLFRVPPLVVGHHKTIPASWYNVDCLDLAQVLCRSTKLLWVPECRTPAILRRCYFCSHPPWSLALTTSLSPFQKGPWDLSGGWYRCSIGVCALDFWYLFPALRPIVSLCVNYHQLHKEPFLIRSERCANWVRRV